MHLANFLAARIGAYSGFEFSVCKLRRPALKNPGLSPCRLARTNQSDPNHIRAIEPAISLKPPNAIKPNSEG